MNAVAQEKAKIGMDVSVIIVNWNVRDLLADCLRSLEKYHGTLSIETLVIDSASRDDSVAMLRQAFPWVRLMAQSENVGFVAGNNLGLAAAQGRYLFLLNPDTLLHPYALQKLADYLEAHPQIGIVGPHTLNSDGTHQSTRRRFPSLLTGMFESTWLQALAPRWLLDRYYVRDLPDEGIFEVDWVQGSALLARREVYTQIGGLDPAYHMFFEEQDWCKRAKLAGWGVAYVGDAYITHHGGKSTDQVVTRKHVHFQHSKIRYFRKFHGRWAAVILRLVLILHYALQILIEGSKALAGHKFELRRERIRAYAVVLKSLLWAGERGVIEA
jgi:hypothetical protein